MGGLQVLKERLPSGDLGLSELRRQTKVWESAAGVQQGRSHVQSSTPCQDFASVRAFPGDALVSALSDGAGSARFSHYGAQLLVERAHEAVAMRFDQLSRATNNLGRLRESLADDLQRALRDAAAEGIDLTDDDRVRLNLPPRAEEPFVRCDERDLAATLLVVAVKAGRFVAIHIGDGVIGIEQVMKSGIKLRPLSVPDNGEFINETKFVTSKNLSAQMRIYRGLLDTSTRKVSGFVLMSDGPEESLYKRSTGEMAAACSKLLQACRDLPEDVLQEQLNVTLRDVIAQRTHDDCSLALLARNVPEFSRDAA